MTTIIILLFFSFLFLISKQRKAVAALNLSKNNFQWSASVDSTSGVASSLEESLWHSSLSKKRASLLKFSKQTRILASEIFESYPHFLSLKKVTFGLCSVKKNDNKVDHCIDLYCTLFKRVTLLSFGRPTKSFYNSKESASQQHYGVVTEIPILGGCLVNNRIRKVKDEESTNPYYYGRLRFELIIQDLAKEGNKNEFPYTARLKTQIIGYKSAIVGDVPVNPLRKLTYLSTQRLVHAYVMFRFHAYASSQIIDNVHEKAIDHA